MQAAADSAIIAAVSNAKSFILTSNGCQNALTDYLVCSGISKLDFLKKSRYIELDRTKDKKLQKLLCIGESGRPRNPWKVEIVGSNPTTQTQVSRYCKQR